MITLFGGSRSSLKLRFSGTFFGLLGCVCLFIVAPRPACAQAVYGSIFGTVTDNTGAVIPNATITVTDISKNTSVTTTTNSSGDYTVQHLIPDTYQVTAEASGFSKSSAQSVLVYADTSPKVNLTMQVGAVSNTVTVTAAAPLLETDRADVSTILNARAVSDLPNLQRNFTSFELLTPGTTYIGWNVGPDTNPQQSEQIEVNGQLPFATGYELDGTDNQDPIIGVEVINPDLDAVSEMKVTSQDYDAEFGGAVAGMVTAQTKSGSNDFHGSVFEFRRSDAQQARDPFTQIAPAPLPSFVHNQFGGAVGGPIFKDKLFFFGDYQGLREKTGQTILTTVPTATAHTTCTSGGDCDLSDYLNPAIGGGPTYQAYDPETDPTDASGRTAFGGNIIPVGRLSAPAVKLMSEMPMPNFGNGSIFDNFAGSGSGGFNTNQFDVRIDGQMSQKFHAFGRYTRFGSNLNGTPVFGAAGGAGFGLGGFAGTDTAMDQSVAAGGDYSFSSKWLTDFRFGWFRIRLNEVGPDFNQPLGTQLGIGGVNQGDLTVTGGLPQFSIAVPANGTNGGNNVNYGTTTNLFEQVESQFQGVTNWTRYAGNHDIKFGADIRFALNHLVGVNNNNLPSGQFQFPEAITSGPASQGLGFATFVLGDMGSFNRTVIQNTNAAERQRRWFFYGQDQWRATQKLTVNYGVRWDLFFPERVAGKGQGGLLDLNSGNVRIAGYGPYNDSMNVAMEYTHLSPRIGLAWQVMPKTVVRAGYGRAYGMGWSGDIFGEVLTFSYPTAVVQNFTAPSGVSPITQFDLTAGPPAFPFPAVPSSGDFPLPDTIQLPTRPLTMRVPTLDAWNLMIQQELTQSSSLQIGYVGSHGVHNMFDSSNQADPNQPTLAGFDCSAAPIGCAVPPMDPDTGTTYTRNERQPYFDGTAQRDLGVKFGVPHMWTQSFRFNANEATTKYNALQVMFQKRYSQGFQMLAHYTWSQARANESDYFFNDSRADFGNSYYNRRQVFVLTGDWDLPFGRQKAIGGNAPGWVNEIIGGFALNGTETWESGIPFTPTYSLCSQDEDIDGTGGSLCRPDGIGNAPTASLHLGSFDPAAHNVRYFSPVPTLAFAGDVEGPYRRPNPGTFGSLQRDSLWGPGLVNTDLSLGKKFFFTERMDLQMQVQAFNLFNHPNLGGPNNCVDCGSSSGLINDIVASQDGTTMRRLQFSARFQF